MDFSNPIPRSNLPRPREGSALASPLESNSPMHDWKRTQDALSRAGALTGAVAQIQRQVARIAQRNMSDDFLRPFTIYQYPSFMRYFHPSDESQRLKVRTGRVITPSFSQVTYGSTAIQAINVAGCDIPYNLLTPTAPVSDLDIYLYSSMVPPSDGSNFVANQWSEVTVPNDGSTYYFWITCLGKKSGSFTGQTHDFVVVFGKDPSDCIETESGSSGPDVWPGFPNDDPYHKLIGVVWYDPTSTPAMNIRQVIRDDVVWGFGINPDGSAQPGISMRYRGQEDSNSIYYVGDIVWTYNPPPSVSTDFRMYYILKPPIGTAYKISEGPIHGGVTDPSYATNDPWEYLGTMPVNGFDIWANSPFDGSKYYIQSALL